MGEKVGGEGRVEVVVAQILVSLNRTDRTRIARRHGGLGEESKALHPASDWHLLELGSNIQNYTLN